MFSKTPIFIKGKLVVQLINIFKSEVDENDVETVQNRKRPISDSGEDMPNKRTRRCSNSW